MTERLLAARAAHKHLQEMYQRGELSGHAWSILKPEMDEAEETIREQLGQMVQADPFLEEKEVTAARRELLVTQRGALHSLQRDGLIDSDVFEALVAEIDYKLDRLEEKED